MILENHGFFRFGYADMGVLIKVSFTLIAKHQEKKEIDNFLT